MHNKTKHLDIKLFFVRDHNNRSIGVEHINTNNNCADIFTKPLPIDKFKKFVKVLNSREGNSLEEAHLIEDMKVKQLFVYILLLSSSVDV